MKNASDDKEASRNYLHKSETLEKLQKIKVKYKRRFNPRMAAFGSTFQDFQEQMFCTLMLRTLEL